MKKQAIAAAVAVALGVSTLSVEANTSGLTGTWSGTYLFSMYSAGGGPVGTSPPPNQTWTWDFNPNSANSTFGTVDIPNTTAFFGNVWTAHDVTFSDNGSSYGPAGGVNAINMLFDYQTSTNIQVTEDWDVQASGNAVNDTATVTVNYGQISASSPVFASFQPFFTGTLTKISDHSSSVVPVPAAVWLMGSGLMGLVGVARRRRKS